MIKLIKNLTGTSLGIIKRKQHTRTIPACLEGVEGMKIKVLVVEDNLSLNRSIVNMLKKEDYRAFGALDLDDSKEIFEKEDPHIILLDIMLPHGYGYELINVFRRNYSSRIIILTALDDEQSKRMCYESGADDYITKPFDLYELLYKLNALRRWILINLREYHIGDIIFNTETNELICKEKKIIIQPSQIRLLKLLYDKYMENSYMDKSKVFGQISENIDETGRLQTMMARLRKNISYVGSQQVDIETIYGKGYKIVVR